MKSRISSRPAVGEEQHAARPAAAMVDRRPASLAQARLQQAADSSPQALQLAAMPGGGVVQRNHESEAPYATHKDGHAGESQWDKKDEKKQALWEKMKRDEYEGATEGFLGATGDNKTPTTHHVLSKSRLPQFEFKLGNLRLGPNRGLRALDPDQSPDYNNDYDGQLTPRSKRIAENFEGKDKQGLKETFESMESGTGFDIKDFDQWYISRAHWDNIAAGWEEKDAFWEANKENYVFQDHTKPLEKREKETVLGIPWAKTKAIPADAKSKFNNLKEFITRGSLMMNDIQKPILRTFNVLKERTVDQLLENPELARLFNIARLLNTSDVEGMLGSLQSKRDKRLSPLLLDLSQFSHKVEDPRTALALLVEKIRGDAEVALKEGWQDIAKGRLEGRTKDLRTSLGKAYMTRLVGDERVWLEEFRQAKERQAPYDLSDEERMLHLSTEADIELGKVLEARLQGEPLEHIPELPEDGMAKILLPFLEQVDELKKLAEAGISKWEEEGAKAKYTCDQIKKSLLAYGINPTKKARQQKAIANTHISNFVSDANRWIEATEWQDVFGKWKTPQSNTELYSLVKALRDTYQQQL